MERPNLGGQELALLRFVAERAPITVGEAAESYGKEHGLARTTILTVMERLRRKGYLRRERAGGVFKYSPCVEEEALTRGLVGEFARRVLGGSARPFMAYLAEDADLSDEEIAELKAMVRRLDERRG